MNKLTKENERSWAIQLIKTIENYAVKNNYVIKKVGGEITISKGKKKMFPDVLLYGDNACQQIIQGWELKMPDVPIENEAFIKDAWRKAETLGLNSTLIWNFRYAVFYVKNSKSGEFEEKKRWDLSKSISTKREDVNSFQNLWLPVLYEVIDTVNAFLALGRYREITIGEALSSKVLENIINDNKGAVADYLEEAQILDLRMNNYLLIWWDGVKEEYKRDEDNKDIAYAKVILLNWVTKFLLAHLIRSRNPAIEKIVDISDSTTPVQALEIFNDITTKCDFYNVFHPMDYQDRIPVSTWNYLLELHSFLICNGLQTLTHAEFQKILENTSKMSNRLVAGQFTTPKQLAEFMVKSTILNARSISIDPCCGSGTIVKEMIEYKNSVIKKYDDSYSTTYGSDKYSFPLQISNISLTKADTMNIPSRLFQKDVFELKTGDRISIVNPNDGTSFDIVFNDIEYIISNLPFIDFERNNKNQAERERYSKIVIDSVKTSTGIELDNRSDYSFFIIFHLWNLLKKNGTLCIVISNSWVGTKSGMKFYEALRYYFHVKSIYVSAAERWFKNAKIVSTVMLLEKKEIGQEAKDYVTHYFRFNKKLCDFSESDMNKAVNAALVFKENDSNVIAVSSHTKEEVDLICAKFGFSRNIGFIDFSWLFKFIPIVKPMSEYFSCFAGIKSGDDKLFYDAKKAKVDDAFYVPMLKNTKSCTGYTAKPDNYVINCTANDYSELSFGDYKKTYVYFMSKENSLKQSTKRHGSPWWKIPQINNRAILFTALAPGRRLFFGRIDQPCVVNQRLVGYYPLSKKIDVDLFHALLNSVVMIFFIEASGFGRGEGVLDLNRTKLANISVLSPDTLSDQRKLEIKKAFSVMKNRDVKKTLEEELVQSDRVVFDKTVLRAYGLETYYDQIVNSLLELHQMRLCVDR